MEVILNILALAGMGIVAYMSSVQGFYRAAMTLAACLLAGAVAFGLFGPLAGLFPVGNLRSVWYYAADGFILWALFCVVFLGLRTLGEALLKVQPAFPLYLDRIGGAVLGAATGYVAVGVCLVVVQMMPLPPTILGYAPFRYDQRRSAEGEVTEEILRGSTLWLAWDRGVLGLYGYVLGGPLGAAEVGPFGRYGDVYPPREMRQAVAPRRLAGAEVVDSDDLLYFHWYRRYHYIKWRMGRAEGPVQSEEMLEAARPGLPLDVKRFRGSKVQDGLDLRIQRADDVEGQLEGYPDVRIGDHEKLVRVTLEFRPAESVTAFPVALDSRQLVLTDPQGWRSEPPLVQGRARLSAGQGEVVTRFTRPAEAEARNLRFHFAGRTTGTYLMDGATFTFSNDEQHEERDFVFAVPKKVAKEDLRLLLGPAPPPAPPAAGGRTN